MGSGEGNNAGSSVRARTLLRMAALAGMTATTIVAGCGSDGGYGVVDPLPPPGYDPYGTPRPLSVSAKLVPRPPFLANPDDAGTDATTDASADAGSDDAGVADDAGIVDDAEHFVQVELTGGNLGGANGHDDSNASLDVYVQPNHGDNNKTNDAVVVRVPKGVNAFVLEAVDSSTLPHGRSVSIRVELATDGSPTATITSSSRLP